MLRLPRMRRKERGKACFLPVPALNAQRGAERCRERDLPAAAARVAEHEGGEEERGMTAGSRSIQATPLMSLGGDATRPTLAFKLSLKLHSIILLSWKDVNS